MSRNEIFRQVETISLPVPNGTAVGAPLRLGPAATGLNAVAETSTGAAGEPTGQGNATGYATVRLGGPHNVYEFQTAIAITAILDPVYITTGGALSASATGNQFYGWALNAKAGTTGALRVLIA